MHRSEKRGPCPLFYFTNFFCAALKFMNIEKRVKALVEDKIADRPDLFIVDIKMPSPAKIIILMDGDNGVPIKDCAAISRHVGFHLEEENVLETAYNLEVSSPGIDHPLTSDRQLLKNIGRNISIKYIDNIKEEGKLTSVTNQEITLEQLVKEKGKKAQSVQKIITKDKITEIKVLISFK